MSDTDLIHNIMVITQVAQRRTPPGHTSHFIPSCPLCMVASRSLLLHRYKNIVTYMRKVHTKRKAHPNTRLILQQAVSISIYMAICMPDILYL